MVSENLIRQKIVTAIVEQMKLISSKNGFYSEAGENVFEWLSKPLEKEDYPAIIVRDPSDDTTDGQVLEHKLKIQIDIAIKDGNNTTWSMREASSDVLKSFGQVETILGYRCAYSGSDSLVEHKDTVYGGVRLEFEVFYQTGRWEQ